MKHGKKPTVKQCELIKAYGFDSSKWLVSKDTPSVMVLVHRKTNAVTEISKE